MSARYAPPPDAATAPRFDLLEKLLRRALDPAALDGEAENSALKFILIARREGIGYEQLAAAIAPPARVSRVRRPRVKRRRRPPACDLVMSFGRHRGRSLGEIATIHLPYLRWLADEIKDPDLRAAAKAVLIHFTQEGA